MCLKTLERQQLTRAPLYFTFKSTHEHDEMNWPTKSAKGFREATLWLTVSGSQAFTYRCEQTQKGDHFDFLTDLSALVPYPTVRTTWSSFVPQEAANTSRDDWSASLAMDTCCCNTSLYPVAILWASPKARSSRRFLGLKTTCNCSRTNRWITQLDETWIVFKKRHTQSDTPQSGSSTGTTTRI